jgi:hypothetical protein
MRLNKLHIAKTQKQAGQALVEFLVIAMALIPLFLLIPVVAKYQSIAHATQMASRYAAFDSLVRSDLQNSSKPLDQLQEEVRRRIFSNSDAPIKSRDVAGDFKGNQNLFWRTPDDKPLIANFADITVTRTKQDSHDGQVFSSPQGPFAIGFGATGIASAHVSVKLANLPSGLKFYEPFDQINLVMNRSTSVLTDGWAGNGPTEVAQELVPLTPGLTFLKPLSWILHPVMALAEPRSTSSNIGQLEFWREAVPVDRLRSEK